MQETRHWDEADGRTHSMRTKEGSSDYRYFPEPDLVPVAPDDEMRAAVRGVDAGAAGGAPGPAAVEEWGIARGRRARARRHAAGWPTTPRRRWLALDGGTARDVVNWCNGDVLGYLNESGLSPAVLPLAPDGLAELVGLVADGHASRATRRRTCSPSASPSRSGRSRSSTSAGCRR